MSEPRKPRQVTQSVLFCLVKVHLDAFIEKHRLPEFIARTFSAFLECGIPEFGCFHLTCVVCKHNELVAFSCKFRGICPSCSARSSADSGLRLVDDVLPHVPFRQWVVSYPFEIGQKLAFQPELISAVERLVHGILRRWMEARGGGQTGGLIFRHRFGSSFNLLMHNHLLIMDGTYHTLEDGSLVFKATPEIDQAELDKLASVISRRIAGLMKRHDITMDRKDAQKNESGGLEGPLSGLAVRHNGLHLFVSSAIPASDRTGLEKLCCYLLRAPFNFHRIRKVSDGIFAYRLVKKDSKGQRELVMTADELLMRLSSLIPTARIPTRRYFGILAGGSEDRSKVTPKPTHRKVSTHEVSAMARAVQRAIPWADLMRRLWDIDVFKCPKCPGLMQIRHVIESLEAFEVYSTINGLARTTPT